MQKKLLLLSFIEGAAVMVAELCGAKLLAPVFGSSLYVWASVMGITLAALAAGYFFGGIISNRSAGHKKNLFRILFAASIFILLMPVLSYYVVPRISYFPFLPAVVLSTLVLLFLPVFLLGASSPLFISAQIKEPVSAGKVSGTVYSVSTLGGIFATFFCGFYLIPAIGLNLTLLIFGGILFVSSILVFSFFKVSGLLIFIALLYLNLQFNYKKSDLLMNSDGLLGHLEVENGVMNSKTVRLLKINGIIQTEMDVKTNKSVSGYVNLLDTLIPSSASAKKALILGLGGGLTANLLHKKNYRVTGIEIDGRIVRAAQKYFHLDNEVMVKCEDARYFINRCEEKFDLILFDVFKAEEQPDHVISMESLKKLKSNLNDSGVVFINWHGYTSGKIGKGTSLLLNTLKESGFRVSLTSLSKDQNYRNIVFVCSLNKIGGSPFEIKEDLLKNTLVNTDDRPLMEYYNAEANKTWRNNYLRYYQNYE